MNLAYHYPIIYWNTACLIVNSGSLEAEKQASTDYGKMARALGSTIDSGIKVSLVDINRSSFGFIPDAENNQILFGMKGLLNVGDDVIKEIIKQRPYVSIKDFYNRVHPEKQTMISLIKSGAFDNMVDRKFAMAWYIWTTCNKKSRLTLQNMPGLIKYDLLPDSTDTAYRVYEFNRYLKAICKKDPTYYTLDERAINFLNEMNYDSLISGNWQLSISQWDKVYQKWMDTFRNWIAADKDNILKQLNLKIFKDDWNKYATGNISSWEMEVMCFYYHDHELIHLNKEKYGISNFGDLPADPIVERSFTKGNNTINIYKLSKICGTCIAKDKQKSTVTLLTTDGVVTVKFRKEYFSNFNKRISEKDANGKKHIIEKSWFERGSMIVVTGIRSDDNFIAKKYASTATHQLYKIKEISKDGDITLQDKRAQGEEDEE